MALTGACNFCRVLGQSEGAQQPQPTILPVVSSPASHTVGYSEEYGLKFGKLTTCMPKGLNVGSAMRTTLVFFNLRRGSKQTYENLKC